MMKTHFFALGLMISLVTTNVFAQEEEIHSDVEFGYNNLANPTEFEIEIGEEDGEPLVTATGVPFFEADFEVLDPMGAPGNYSAEDPGFATANDEGLIANTGDQIFVEILDSSIGALFGGQGFATFYDPTSDSLEAAGDFLITGNSAAFAPLELDDAAVVDGSTVQFIDTVLNNTAPVSGEVLDFDEHIIFDVLDDTTPGAYGFLLQLHSNFAGTSVDQFELTSDPFWVILNNQLSEQDFEEFAVPAFENAAVPEPGTFGLLAAGMSGVLLRRRRR